MTRRNTHDRGAAGATTDEIEGVDVVHGNEGTEGAVRAVGSIAKGMGWEPVSTPLEVLGEPAKADLDACWELGATVAATLLE